MKAKEICAKGFKSMLTIISPMLNTRVLYYVKFHKRLDFNNPVTLNDECVSQGVLYGASTCVG